MKFVVAFLAVTGLTMMACDGQAPMAPSSGDGLSLTGGGFNEFGYNYTARNFNGTGLSWCVGKGIGDVAFCTAYMSPYANDKLIMKWNAEWDRGNGEGWSNPPYDAWENNEWNGRCKGCSGEVWHYKIQWSEACKNGTYVGDGYCIWGQFEVLSDHGSTADHEHLIYAHSKPNGYGN